MREKRLLDTLTGRTETASRASVNTGTKIHLYRGSSCVKWAEDFIFAGSSAAILLLVNLFQNYWYFSFLALIPLIYRISRASAISSLRLGFLFGLSFFVTFGINSILESPARACAGVVSGVIIFTLFAWSVGWARKRFGFNPLIVSLLWAAFEYVLVQFGFVEGLFGESEFTFPFFGALSTIFGFIIVSFIIVLANSLILLAIEKVVSLIEKVDLTIPLEERGWDIRQPGRNIRQSLFLLPELRGPPLS